MRGTALSTIATASLLAAVLAIGSALSNCGRTPEAGMPVGLAPGNATPPAVEPGAGQVPDAAPSVWVLRNPEGDPAEHLLRRLAEPATVVAQSKLVFRQQGDRYSLAEVWVDGQELERQLPANRRASESSQQGARTGVVAALARN